MAGNKMALRAVREQLLSLERLREVLDYNSETGLFRWKVSLNARAPVGSCPKVIVNGYLVLNIDKRRFYQHRLAWFYIYGEWPTELIDHIDGNKSNNRLENLRAASPSENYANGRSYGNRKHGRGVKFVAKNSPAHQWVASTKDGNRWTYLGSFSTQKLALDAYEAFSLKKWGKFLR